ncbi:uncharacterized protein LOC135375559 [Ornithodoros turicata]|uniref:uncharacterized protein LOC135375559 n=1 Tax=Ornithodoros turicata TaxID=34597 RepID=UPI00313984F4
MTANGLLPMKEEARRTRVLESSRINPSDSQLQEMRLSPEFSGQLVKVKSEPPDFACLPEEGQVQQQQCNESSPGGDADGLLNYRTTPLEDGNSPADILMGRRLRSRLPDFGSASQVDVRKHRQSTSRGCHLQLLRSGETVRIHQDGAWTVKAKVQDRLAPRSYKVVTEDNKVLRRNRQHLLPTSEHYVRTTPAMGDLPCTGS